MPILADAVGLPPLVGLLAGLISLWPAYGLEITTPFETTIVSALVILATIFAVRGGWHRNASERSCLLQGALWGILLLFNTTVLIILMSLIAVAAAQYGRLWPKPFLWRVSLTAIALSLVVGPWIFRNYQRFHRFIFIRDNLGLELNVSNSDRARPTLEENRLVMSHPNITPAETTLILQLGEVAYHHDKMKSAMAWIRTNPPRFLALALDRSRFFWFPPDLSRRYRYPVWLVTAAGFVGLGWMFLRHKAAAGSLATLLLSYSAVFAIIQTDFRYRMPVYSFSILPAAYACCRIVSKALGKFGSVWPLLRKPSLLQLK